MDSEVEPTLEPQPGGKTKCPCCGGAEFAWGFCNPGGHGLTFKTEEDSWWVRNTIVGGVEAKARACKTGQHSALHWSGPLKGAAAQP